MPERGVRGPRGSAAGESRGLRFAPQARSPPIFPSLSLRCFHFNVFVSDLPSNKHATGQTGKLTSWGTLPVPLPKGVLWLLAARFCGSATSAQTAPTLQPGPPSLTLGGLACLLAALRRGFQDHARMGTRAPLAAHTSRVRFFAAMGLSPGRGRGGPCLRRPRIQLLLFTPLHSGWARFSNWLPRVDKYRDS